MGRAIEMQQSNGLRLRQRTFGNQPNPDASCPTNQQQSDQVVSTSDIAWLRYQYEDCQAKLALDAVVTTSDTNTLSYEGRKTELTLVNNKIQVAAAKDALQLQGLELNGCIEPVDEKRFTYRAYVPSDTVEVAVPGGGYRGSSEQQMCM